MRGKRSADRHRTVQLRAAPRGNPPKTRPGSRENRRATGRPNRNPGQRRHGQARAVTRARAVSKIAASKVGAVEARDEARVRTATRDRDEARVRTASRVRDEARVRTVTRVQEEIRAVTRVREEIRAATRAPAEAREREEVRTATRAREEVRAATREREGARARAGRGRARTVLPDSLTKAEAILQNRARNAAAET